MIVAVLCAMVVCGCRNTHAPVQTAPELRGPVKDLAAIRGGDQFWLTWTVPRKGTGKLDVNGKITVHVCRRESQSGTCTAAGGSLLLARGVTGSFSEKLPSELASGTPRPLYYFVELMDRNGQSTGLSNSVATLAGAPPPVVDRLTAELTEKGVLLHWTPHSEAEGAMGTAIRIHRTQITRMPPTPVSQPDTQPSDLRVYDMMVDDGSRTGHALDTDIQLGESYEYSAQRVFSQVVGGQTLELAGQFSAPVDIDTTTGAHPH
jgi:hypothetical protein